MKQNQNEIMEFMQKAQQDCPVRPSLPSIEVCALRVKLIKEELDELKDAMAASDLVEVADAITDILVVTLGTAVAFGIDIEPCWNEVHRSNMSKFIDGHKREDGKWIKGPSYSPANLAPIIKAQQTI